MKTHDPAAVKNTACSLAGRDGADVPSVHNSAGKRRGVVCGAMQYVPGVHDLIIFDVVLAVRMHVVRHHLDLPLAKM